ncbi:MAG: N-acetyl-gamma-glutamyl-phosphate reductase, partial [Proteobacteria bacterium]|nr:N-acetyl-gamma-glutamyl-phosphate reductase [Pseudomonadota bacterium]MBU2452329.1 N-acetyl-gamma-glutamyl-phosphate reductase [Pseudomonadota bacterium]
MINVGIAGASGYTGVELVKLISNHHGVRIKKRYHTYSQGEKSELFLIGGSSSYMEISIK